ncbi:HK97-gp10 family putative phage morphogenesis protein [Shinella sp. M31]|uniref:HK97-gp10 family putative phage morphogenesis protein n=1 Tax=Shinella sp. M31 TaxID=3368615 RepID=UPI003B9E7F11
MVRTLEGWQRLQRRLRAIPEAVRQQTQSALVAAANDIANTMKALAPEDDGDLKDSIEVTPGGQATPPHSQPGGATVVPENAAMITAGNSKVRYAHLVEFGAAPHVAGGKFEGAQHPGAPAQPFFFPGYRITKKKAARKIKRAMTKAIKGTKRGN